MLDERKVIFNQRNKSWPWQDKCETECNSVSLMQYIRITYTIMLQVFIMFFNLSCNLGSTQLWWQSVACIIHLSTEKVLWVDQLGYTLIELVNKNIHIFHTNAGYWYAYISCILYFSHLKASWSTHTRRYIKHI